jgi:hypothetical protein
LVWKRGSTTAWLQLLEKILAQLWLCGIVQMGEKDKVSIGFRLFVLGVEIVTLIGIFGGAWLLNKLLIAPPLIVSLRLVRLKIETKYDVFHLASVFACILLSIGVSWFGLFLSLPVHISLMSSVIVGVGFAIISWHIQEIIDLKSKFTRKERLIEKCQQLNYSKMKTDIALQFFIEKKKTKEVWQWICESYSQAMTWDSLYNLKSKMKKDLF